MSFAQHAVVGRARPVDDAVVPMTAALRLRRGPQAHVGVVLSVVERRSLFVVEEVERLFHVSGGKEPDPDRVLNFRGFAEAVDCCFGFGGKLTVRLRIFGKLFLSVTAPGS